ncbi:MAG TPA: alpha/beta hydrolase [Jatrophihabitans sp.]|jgi:acetyl esterase|uniref:alpha/beta hydrolase n=1 Tax=Jatrophihabitans sp. TaxID=1932789 RepID=UPI002DFF50CD|nr:alpha/beta hydrolase [Jatrophihabitans sp.]
MPLDPNIAGFLQFIESEGVPAIADSTVDEARAAIRQLLVELRDPSTLAQVGSIEDATVGDGIPVRVYRPEGDGPFPTIVYFHGGGFVIGDRDTHDGVCRQECRDIGAVVVSVDYRLAPEHRFPAAVRDCYAALNWVAEHIDEYGGDAARLVVGGDSAGGNLAAVCAQKAHADGLALAAQLLVYPAVDMLGDYPSRAENAEGYFLTVADMNWFGGHYLGIDESDPAAAELAVDPELSPLHAESLDGLAPAVVATAEFDPLRDEGNLYAQQLEKAGVKVEHRQFAGLIHGFYGMELLSPAIADASDWINARVKELLA